MSELAETMVQNYEIIKESDFLKRNKSLKQFVAALKPFNSRNYGDDDEFFDKWRRGGFF